MIQTDVNQHHPTIYKLIELFRLEQRNTEVINIQLDTGDKYEKTNKSKRREDRINAVLVSYNKKEVLQYLDNMTMAMDFIENNGL